MVTAKILQSYQQCLDEAKDLYEPDPEIMEALVELDLIVQKILNTLNHRYPVEALSAAAIEQLKSETNVGFLRKFMDRNGDTTLISLVLQETRVMRPLAWSSSSGDVDDQSQVITWGGAGSDAPQAISIYLHYPDGKRCLMFVSVEMPQYLDEAIDEIKHAGFNWSNIAPDYIKWRNSLENNNKS